MRCAYCLDVQPYDRAHFPDMTYERDWLCSERDWLAAARAWALLPRWRRLRRWTG